MGGRALGGFYSKLGPRPHWEPLFPTTPLNRQLRVFYASYGKNERSEKNEIYFRPTGNCSGNPFRGPPSKHTAAAATVLFGEVFCAGTHFRHRRLKTHARADSGASLESIISTTRQGPAAGDPLGKVFSNVFPAHRKLLGKPILCRNSFCP